MDPIMDLAGEYGLRVVEDNAQALGARYRGRGAGSLGHAAATSFYPGKNLGAAGDGGAVTTDDAEIAERVRVLRNHGQVRKYEHAEVGFNSRLDALQAVVLGVKLRRLHEWNDRRRRIAGEYRLRLPDRLAMPQEASDRTHTYHLFVIRDDERDWLKQELENAKIGVGLHYPVPIHLTQPFLHLGSGPGSFPVAEDWASRGLSLPMFPTMTLEQVDRTVGAIHDIVEAGDVLQSRTA
jgi:dTDP-4-amino-4,6-dideoxygalactose transaminase